ncbi:hypothetical protein [Tabrizicola soli]|uniref:Uncharacterized protein n=2 Tax=Tabrizicola soli TaxID=2185115 RepID=A0ABV7DVE1_9RHOB|nr:hypothetical protein [Tabrizicola soli]
MPDLTRIYAADLALPSDPGWLRDNPEAVARVRAFRDETRTNKRVILLTVRLLDTCAPDGWRPAYVEAHPGHWDSPAFRAWQDRPGDMVAANDFALTVLTADADVDVDAGHALPDTSGLPPHWCAQFRRLALDNRNTELKSEQEVHHA